MLWGCKGKELGGEPVEVAHIYPLESLVSVTIFSSIHYWLSIVLTLPG